eukprot:365864-Chlamydomonas_euryale.AAC.12
MCGVDAYCRGHSSQGRGLEHVRHLFRPGWVHCSWGLGLYVQVADADVHDFHPLEGSRQTCSKFSPWLRLSSLSLSSWNASATNMVGTIANDRVMAMRAQGDTCGTRGARGHAHERRRRVAQEVMRMSGGDAWRTRPCA